MWTWIICIRLTREKWEPLRTFEPTLCVYIYNEERIIAETSLSMWLLETWPEYTISWASWCTDFRLISITHFSLHLTLLLLFSHLKFINYVQYSPGPSGGPGDSPSLKACQALLDEYLPALKALPGASITRQVCGGCLDFKVSITQPLKEHGEWAEANYDPLESEFLAKLKAIEGTSMHETQEITFETL